MPLSPMPRAAIFRHFAGALALATAAVAAFGAVRLTHQFPAAAASPGLLLPFLLPVLALALEAGALIALSVALFFVLTRGAEPGPLRTLTGRARVSLPLPGLALLVLALAELIPRGTEHPGAFANQLVQSARDSCGAGGQVPVPLLGLSVRCTAPQRIEGPMPGARKAQLAMDRLQFSDDLRRVEISGLELSLASSLRVKLRAQRATVSGLAPWSRSPRLSPFGRFGLLAGLGAVLWLGVSLLVRPRPRPPRDPARTARLLRWLGYLLFAAPGAVVAAAVISLDQVQAAPSTYAAAGLAGAATLGLVAWIAARAPQITG
jgi:hypothetical protein